MLVCLYSDNKQGLLTSHCTVLYARDRNKCVSEGVCPYLNVTDGTEKYVDKYLSACIRVYP